MQTWVKVWCVVFACCSGVAYANDVSHDAQSHADATVEVVSYVPPVAHEKLADITVDPALLHSADPRDNFEDQLPYYATAMALIKSQYVRPVLMRDLVQESLKGVALSLDPYCEYLDEEAFAALKTEVNGKYAGIGARIGMRNGHVEVLSVLKKSPAEKAGLCVGAIITHIDSVRIAHMPLPDVVALLRGEKGSVCELTVFVDGGEQVVRVTRKIIDLDSVEVVQMLSGGVAYVRIIDFDHNTFKLLKKELKEIKKNDATGLIVDLRWNAGGLLESCVDVADLFLDEGALILTARNREGVETLRFEASKHTSCPDIPLVVLVNQASASAAEVLAGALRDHGRAVVVGEQTFGKGSVQMVVPFPDKTAFRLTTALYYLPGGETIDGVGIIPAVSVSPGMLERDGDGVEHVLLRDAQVQAAYIAARKKNTKS